jgi:hypothetical protein
MGARPRKRRTRSSNEQSHETASTEVGVAFVMPGEDARAAAADMNVDFQAKQDSISETRRTAGPKLAPKVKRTTAKPAHVKETKI